MKKIVVGILAHVDAGKTTLSESMLYLSGKLRQIGRVDHGDAFLDYDEQERQRGITIFSKQARLSWKDTEIIFVDTPGHIDFSSEMERTLQVLDYAIVVISGLDGVQNHSETIWKLLETYHIPTFIFVNKMDMALLSQEELMNHLQEKLTERCLDFQLPKETFYENLSILDDDVFETYVNHQCVDEKTIAFMILQRKVFPCFFGSALKNQNVDVFLDAINQYTIPKEYPSDFGARVFKIAYDEKGNRLTHLKITGGCLKTKEILLEDEKVDQIRIYSGHKYEMVQQVNAGDICVVTGLKQIQTGDGLGFEKQSLTPVLLPYMNYRIVLPENCNQHELQAQLMQLSQEDPTLHIHYDASLDELHIQLMGEIQIEVLKKMVKERFYEDIDFDHGKILYKETIDNKVEGVGHFEPLRHYAEVHVLLEKGEEGSGLVFQSNVSDDKLASHWQRLIMTHLKEKEHMGVLTGSPITDMKITLVGGKAHQKHTEGGDFRQATYRAVRQGLKKANSILLEPYFHFRLQIPNDSLSRALYDIEMMHGHASPQILSNEVIIEGEAPVACMQDYQSQVIAYTKGKGKLVCSMSGYKPCHNSEEVIAQIGYDSEADIENPTGSVFCQHGAGFYVPYDEVENYMHVPLTLETRPVKERTIYHYQSSENEDEELERIFVQTYGRIERKRSQKLETKETVPSMIQKPKRECLLVDGYNVIHAWDELKVLAQDNLDGARFRLMDMMCNYQGYKNCELILVFDAYKVKGNLGTSQKYHNIYVIYTKEAQTADMYIERATRQLASEYNVVVATSDALEQLIVTGGGARRMSSRELKLELDYMNQTKQKEYKEKQKVVKNTPMSDLKDYKK